jgi:hypothetical protein
MTFKPWVTAVEGPGTIEHHFGHWGCGVLGRVSGTVDGLNSIRLSRPGARCRTPPRTNQVRTLAPPPSGDDWVTGLNVPSEADALDLEPSPPRVS